MNNCPLCGESYLTHPAKLLESENGPVLDEGCRKYFGGVEIKITDRFTKTPEEVFGAGWMGKEGDEL